MGGYYLYGSCILRKFLCVRMLRSHQHELGTARVVAWPHVAWTLLVRSGFSLSRRMQFCFLILYSCPLSAPAIVVDLAATSQAQYEVQRRLLGNVVIGQRAPVLELLSGEDEALLVGRDAFLVLDLLLDLLDRVAGLHVERDRFARERLHEDLHGDCRLRVCTRMWVGAVLVYCQVDTMYSGARTCTTWTFTLFARKVTSVGRPATLAYAAGVRRTTSSRPACAPSRGL